MSIDTASEIARLGIASVSPTAGGEWRVTGVSKVGAVRLGDVQVNIEPKIPLERLFYLLAKGQEWGSWFEDSVRLETITELYPAIAEAFSTWAERVLRAGILRGYRTVRSAEPAIRGRWLVAEQIRTRQGLPLPAELQYDEFTSDITENQLVRSAARRLITLTELPISVRARLLRIELQLGDASLLTRGQSPHVRFDRRNERYRPLVALAELILSGGSLDHRVASTQASGFLLSLPKIFEKFVEVEVTRAAREFGGKILPQFETGLDLENNVRIQPDLVWRRNGQVRAVFDAKYKAEKPAGFPNADIYQMLAYCVRHRLTTGHLIYAAGNSEPAKYTIVEAGVQIHCHALALDATPAELAAQVDSIVAASVNENLCILEMAQADCDICRTGSRPSRSHSSSLSRQDKMLIYCPSITDDSVIHFSRRGDSYRLRAFVGRLAGKPEWKQADAATADEFLRLYKPQHQLDVMDELVNLERLDRWTAIVTARNRTLGIAN